MVEQATLRHESHCPGIVRQGSSSLVCREGCRRKVAARALHYLHVDAQIVHLDVKPKNILWRVLDNKVALADFGLAECIAPAKPFREVYCTANYRPPELWPDTGGGQTPGNLLQPAVDMWSFGCTWWQLVVGKMFFMARAEGKLGQVIE